MEEEDEFNEVQAVQGEVLVGLVLCLMGTLYFLHYPDKDIRKYASSAMSDTISIFSAVLTFSSLNSFLESHFVGSANVPAVMAFRCFVCFFWYMFMLTILSLFTGVIGKTNEERLEITMDPVRMQTRKNGIKLAGVFGHITGFAGISFWSHLQSAFLADSPTASLLVIPLSLISCLVWIHCTMHLYRGWVMKDKHVDQLEQLWEGTIWELENDFVALIESFLLVQSVRFAILGRMPSPEGSDDRTVRRSGLQIFELYLFSVLVFMTCCGMILWKTKFAKLFARGLKQARERVGGFWSRWFPRMTSDGDLRRPLNPQEAEALEEGGAERHLTLAADVWRAVTKQLGRQLSSGVTKMSSLSGDIELSFYMRILDIFQNMFIMTYAWSFFFASRWLLDGWHFYGIRSFTGDAALPGVGLNVAAFVTFSSALLIVLLDTVHDKAGTSKDVRRVLRRICEGVGIVIGFAWEQCFDVAAGAVGVKMWYSSFMRVGLSLLCVGVVVPAWLWHIIPAHEEKGYLFGVVPTQTASRLQDALRGAANDPEKVKRVTCKWKAMLKELQALQARMGTLGLERGGSTLMSTRASTHNGDTPDHDATSDTPIKHQLAAGLGPMPPPPLHMERHLSAPPAAKSHELPPLMLHHERNESAPSTARSHGLPPASHLEGHLEGNVSATSTARVHGKSVSFLQPSEPDVASQAELVLLVQRWEQTSQQVLRLLEHLEGGSMPGLPSKLLEDKSAPIVSTCLTTPPTTAPTTVGACLTGASSDRDRTFGLSPTDLG